MFLLYNLESLVLLFQQGYFFFRIKVEGGNRKPRSFPDTVGLYIGLNTLNVYVLRLGFLCLFGSSILLSIIETPEWLELSYIILFKFLMKIGVFQNVFTSNFLETVEIELSYEGADI